MSKVEVDQVTQQSGTTLTVGGGACKTAVVDATTVTLGRCGGTVSLASGATQSGFGRTGTVDWITTPKVTGDSPVTGVSGKGYFLNTTGGAITFNLPAGSAGDIISMADYAATWQTYSVTVSPNGTDKIGSLNENATLSTEGQSVTFVYVDGVQGWINTMDSTSNVRGAPPFMIATVSGACNTLTTAPCCANVKVAKFVNPGTFCVSQAATCATHNLVSYMVVAGGAGGGYGAYPYSSTHLAGAGGAGGYRELVSPSTPYTGSPLNGYPTPGNRITVSASPYPITVGGGGPVGPGASANGGMGSPSVFDTITSAGGGSGGGGDAPGVAGGSGGGGGAGPMTSQPGGAGNTPSTTPAQGFAGGSGQHVHGGARSGGGGGATAAGQNGTGGGYPVSCTSQFGLGGNGATTEITGSPVAYAGGGGGSSNCGPVPIDSRKGGDGGGGAGACNATNVATAGTVNTGGGGGAGSANGATYSQGAAGGSGIVIIRYKFQ